MTSPFYTGLGVKAATLLAKFGKSITIQRTVNGAYSPVTGAPAKTVTTQAVAGVVLDFTHRQINGATILAGDRRVLLPGNKLSFELNPTTDRLLFNGKEHEIIHVQKPVDEPVLLDVHVRGTGGA